MKNVQEMRGSDSDDEYDEAEDEIHKNEENGSDKESNKAGENDVRFDCH